MMNFSPLLSRFIKFFVAGALVYLLLASIFVCEREKREIELQQVALIEKLALTVSKSASIALFVENEAIANEVMNALLLHDEIAGVSFMTLNSRDLGRMDHSLYHQGQSYEEFMTFPLYDPSDGLKIGYLVIHSNMPLLAEKTAVVLNEQLNRQTLQFAIMFVLILFAVRHLVAEPLKRLALKVSRLQPGDGVLFDVELEATSSEIAQVMNSFNRFSESSTAMLDSERGLREKIESMESHYRNLALIDPLTQLASRFGSERYIEERLGDTEGFALFIFDLDGFKAVNDEFGHHSGDEVLVEVARRVNSITPSNALAARLGGDEILVALAISKETRQSDLLKLAYQYIALISEPILLVDGHKIRVGCSIGVGCEESRSFNLSRVMKHADEALYYVKKHGKNGVRLNLNVALLD